MNKRLWQQKLEQINKQWRKMELKWWGFQNREHYQHRFKMHQIMKNLGIVGFVISKQCLHLANFNASNPQHMDIVSAVMLTEQTSLFCFVECEITKDFIEIIKNALICFSGCSLGNNMANLLTKRFCSNLKHLSIKHDPIGNKGIEKLMALDLPNFTNFMFTNLNITTDCTKLFRKRQWKGQISGVMVSYQKGFRYNTLLEQMARHIWVNLASFFEVFQPGLFIYLPLLSKVKLECQDSNIIIWQDEQDIFFESESHLLPQRTKTILQSQTTIIY